MTVSLAPPSSCNRSTTRQGQVDGVEFTGNYQIKGIVDDQGRASTPTPTSPLARRLGENIISNQYEFSADPTSPTSTITTFTSTTTRLTPAPSAHPIRFGTPPLYADHPLPKRPAQGHRQRTKRRQPARVLSASTSASRTSSTIPGFARPHRALRRRQRLRPSLRNPRRHRRRRRRTTMGLPPRHFMVALPLTF